MLNNILNRTQPDIVRKQLIALMQSVNRAIQRGDIAFVEEILSAISKAIRDAGSNVYEPVFKIDRAVTGTSPDPDHYNSIFRLIVDDIDVVFKELESTGDIVVANFNRLVDEERAITARMRKIYGKLQDLNLFSSDVVGRATYAGDDFGSYDKTEFDERFVGATPAYVDIEQGLVTLPRLLTSSELIVNLMRVNTESNGLPGNNNELSAAAHDDMASIIDNDPDTWWEFEKVGSGPSRDSLILSLTLTLAVESVVNFIRINPNNFGTTNWVKIRTIETSTDDRIYTSIRESIDIEGFNDLLQDEDFTLAPSVSKFAGQGLYSMSPRKVKYIRFVFEQEQGYWIDNTQNTRSYRYAIGLRDITINGINYSNSGIFVSTPHFFSEDVKKIALIEARNPSKPSELAVIEHYVSVDDGRSWHTIQPSDGEDPDIPKIRGVNDASEDSIDATSSPRDIRYKAVLRRESDGFKADSAAVRKQISSTYDLRQIPAGSPYQMAVAERPVAGSVRIVNPIYGSKGWNSPKIFVGLADGTVDQIFYLHTNVRIDEEFLYVDSQRWTRVTDLTGKFYSYIIQPDGTDLEGNPAVVIKFGDNGDGDIPPRNSAITLAMPAERVVVEGQRPHRIDLENISDGDKTAIRMIRWETQEDVVGEIVNQSASVIRLLNSYIEPTVTVVIREPAVPARFILEKTFVDGVSELPDPGDYSIDYTNGIIYLNGQTWESGTTTFNYTYTPFTEIAQDFFSFVDETDYQSLEMDHDAFRSTKEELDVDSQTGTNSIILDHETVVRGSVSFVGTDAAQWFTQEIPFIDGLTEFRAILDVKDELVPTGGNSFILVNIPHPSYPVTFSDTTVFATEVTYIDGSTEFTPTPGEYSINYSTGDVYTVSTLDDGTVSYKYEDNGKKQELIESYSVDYREGIVYLNLGRTLPALSSVKYEWTNYGIAYRIAKELPSSTFKVSPDEKLITILDPMVLEDYVPSTRQSGLVKILYDYVDKVVESIEDLEPYFTPVVKGYALKVLTTSLL